MSRLTGYGYKPKQLLIPMELYRRIQRRCYIERDTNESRIILKLVENGLTIPPEPVDPLPDVVPSLDIESDAEMNQPEIVRLRKIFPNNEEEVQRQLKEIKQGLRDVGETEDNIYQILYGSEEKDE